MAIRVRNANAVTVAITANWSTTPTHTVLWANGVPVDGGALSGAISTPSQSDSLSFPAGSFQYDNAIANQNEPGVMQIFSAAVAAGSITWKVSLHDGAPGADYTANELTAGNAPGYTPGNGGRLTITAQVVSV